RRGGGGRAGGRLPALRRLPPEAGRVRAARHARVPGALHHHHDRRAFAARVRAVSWREAGRLLVERAGFEPRVGIVLGSGLGPVGDAVEGAPAIPYSELPGFPEPTVEGHAGQAVAGHMGDVPVVAFQGRAHLYEGGDLDQIRTPGRALRAAGAETLVLTNAAGSMRIDLGPGRLMLIEDHINLSGVNILGGPNVDELGPRF